jgi:hypothetical protein
MFCSARRVSAVEALDMGLIDDIDADPLQKALNEVR